MKISTFIVAMLGAFVLSASELAAATLETSSDPSSIPTMLAWAVSLGLTAAYFVPQGRSRHS